MFEGRFVFAQVTEFVPWYEFDKFVAKYNGYYRAHGFNCKDQFLHLLFGRLTACSSLRDICLCLIAHENCVYHLGFRKTVDPSTLSRANERRDYRIWEDLGYYLIGLVSFVMSLCGSFTITNIRIFLEYYAVVKNILLGVR